MTTEASPTTFSAPELAARIGIRPSTLHTWLAIGLIPSAPFRGRATRYTEAHWLRGLAVRALRAENLSLENIQRRLASSSDEEITRLAQRILAPATPAPEAPLPAIAYPAARWERIEILDGLEIHVRSDGPEALRRLADAIYRNYGSRPQ